MSSIGKVVIDPPETYMQKKRRCFLGDIRSRDREKREQQKKRGKITTLFFFMPVAMVSWSLLSSSVSMGASINGTDGGLHTDQFELHRAATCGCVVVCIEDNIDNRLLTRGFLMTKLKLTSNKYLFLK